MEHGWRKLKQVSNARDLCRTGSFLSATFLMLSEANPCDLSEVPTAAALFGERSF